MDPKVFLKSSVVHRWQYVTPAQLAIKIRRMHATCGTTTRYLDCVLQHAEVSTLAKSFSELHEVPALADPEAFLEQYDLMEEESA